MLNNILKIYTLLIFLGIAVMLLGESYLKLQYVLPRGINNANLTRKEEILQIFCDFSLSIRPDPDLVTYQELREVISNESDVFKEDAYIFLVEKYLRDGDKANAVHYMNQGIDVLNSYRLIVYRIKLKFFWGYNEFDESISPEFDTSLDKIQRFQFTSYFQYLYYYGKYDEILKFQDDCDILIRGNLSLIFNFFKGKVLIKQSQFKEALFSFEQTKDIRIVGLNLNYYALLELNKSYVNFILGNMEEAKTHFLRGSNVVKILMEPDDIPIDTTDLFTEMEDLTTQAIDPISVDILSRLYNILSIDLEFNETELNAFRKIREEILKGNL